MSSSPGLRTSHCPCKRPAGWAPLHSGICSTEAIRLQRVTVTSQCKSPQHNAGTATRRKY
eukprot:8267463-Pyramimonas_sp.AAC.1